MAGLADERMECHWYVTVLNTPNDPRNRNRVVACIHEVAGDDTDDV